MSSGSVTTTPNALMPSKRKLINNHDVKKKRKVINNIFTENGIQELNLSGGTGARTGNQVYVLQFSCKRRWKYVFPLKDVEFTYKDGAYTLEYTTCPPDAKAERKAYKGLVIGNRLEGLKYFLRKVTKTNVELFASWKLHHDYMCCDEQFAELIRFEDPVTEINGMAIGDQSYSDCHRSCGKCYRSWALEKCYNCEEETHQTCQYCDTMMCEGCYVGWGDDCVCVNCFQGHYIPEYRIVKGDADWDYEYIGFVVAHHKFKYYCPSDSEE